MHALCTLFDWMLSTSIRAAVLTLVVLAVQAVLRRKLPASWRYGLWLPVIIVLIMPMRPASSWSLESLCGHPVSPVLPSMSTFSISASPTGSDWQIHATSTAAAMSTREWLALIWFAGFVASASAGALAYHRLLSRIQRTSRPADAELLSQVNRLATETGLKRTPSILISSTITSPAVCGLVSPALLLNPTARAQMSADEFDTVLRHELTHIRRGDLWGNALACALLALHWFNPVLWLAFFRSRLDRESACDADVLRQQSREQRAAYGHTLLKVESLFQRQSFSLGFVGMHQRGRALQARLRLIVSPPRLHWSLRPLVVLSAMALTFLGISQGSDAPKPPPPAMRDPSVQAKKAAELRLAREQTYDIAQCNLGDVLRFLAKDSGLHFISLPDDSPIASRLVTFKTEGSPFSVLETICRAHGLDIILDGDMWYFRPHDDPELVGQSYKLPKLKVPVTSVMDDIKHIIDLPEKEPKQNNKAPADAPTPKVIHKEKEGAIYVVATRLQHTWLEGYFTALSRKQ